jgi:hypothetical protein
MDVLAPALEEKKGTSPPLLKTDGEARPSQDKAREREWSDTPPAQAQTSSSGQYLRHHQQQCCYQQDQKALPRRT